MNQIKSKIVEIPPGPKLSEWIRRNDESRAQKPRYLASKAKGAYITDFDGNVFLDFYSQEVHVGHTHPKVMEAINQQISSGGLFVGLSNEILFAEKLKEITPIKLKNLKVVYIFGII